MAADDPGKIVARLKKIQLVEVRPEATGTDRKQSRDDYLPQRLAGEEGKRRVDAAQGFRRRSAGGTVIAEANVVEQPLAEDASQWRRRVLVARSRAGSERLQGVGDLVPGVVEGIPPEDPGPVRKAVVYAPGEKIFVVQIRSRGNVLSGSVAEVAPVRERDQIQIPRDRRVDNDFSQPRNVAVASGGVRNNGLICDSQPLPQAFVTGQEKSPVPRNRPTDDAPELVTGKMRNLLISRIEKVFGVEGAVPHELERRTMPLVVTGARDCADNAARAAPVFGAVAVGQHAELLQSVHTQQQARHAARRVVVAVVDVRLVQHKADLVGTPASDRKLDPAAGRIRSAAGWGNARFEQRKLDDVAPVQWQFADRVSVHDAG